MEIAVSREGWLTAADGTRLRCALGPAGVVPACDKREGDGATPAGVWRLLRVLYRPDRVSAPVTGLPVTPLEPDDGWCDDPADPAYNAPVKLPYAASAERMWRDDGLYDVVVVLDHNAPPHAAPGAGSAIFLHCARSDFRPTQGCVAVEREALIALLAGCAPGDALAVA